MQIAAIIITVLATLGAKEIVSLLFARMLKNRDDKKSIELTSDARHVDADISALNHFATRLETVEAELKQLQVALTDQRIENVRLDEANKTMKTENSRQREKLDKQQKQIEELSRKLQDKETSILELTAALKNEAQRSDTFSSELHHTTAELNELKRVVEDLIGNSRDAKTVIRDAKYRSISAK